MRLLACQTVISKTWSESETSLLSDQGPIVMRTAMGAWQGGGDGPLRRSLRWLRWRRGAGAALALPTTDPPPIAVAEPGASCGHKLVIHRGLQKFDVDDIRYNQDAMSDCFRDQIPLQTMRSALDAGRLAPSEMEPTKVIGWPWRGYFTVGPSEGLVRQNAATENSYI